MLKTSRTQATLTWLCAAFSGLGLTLGLSGCQTTSAHKQMSVALIPKGTTDEFWKSLHAGGEKAGREMGVQVIWQGPLQPDDRNAQYNIVENMVVRGVSGIALAPVDDMALRGPVEDAYRASIPVVVVDSNLKSNRTVSFIATDNYRGGFMGAQHLAKLIGGKGRVAMIRDTEGNESTDNRERGFLDGIKTFPGVVVASSEQHSGSTSESAYQAGENLISRFKTKDGRINLDGIFTVSEHNTFGMMRALQDSGLSGKVRFVGFDCSAKLVKAMEDGTIDALVVQNPMRIGYLGVKTLVEHLRGEKVDPDVSVSATIVTRDNLKQPEISQLVHPDFAQWVK